MSAKTYGKRFVEVGQFNEEILRGAFDDDDPYFLPKEDQPYVVLEDAWSVDSERKNFNRIIVKARLVEVRK